MRLRHLSISITFALLAALTAPVPAGELFEPGRVVVRYYKSELDDTDQPYSVWLPRDYAPGRAWPLVVSLHGLGGSYRIGGVPREIEDCVVVAPDGRGDTDYKLWGETDVVRVVEEALKRYSIDPNRVYLYGISMGGSGSWQIGAHYPDLFAALGPVCGNADHRVWERLWQWGERKPTFLTEKKAFVEATESPAFFAENLINLPSWPIHGDKDNVVPCDHSRSMAAELKKVGAECHYVEVPGAGHGVPGDKVAEMLLWMKKQRRDPWPKRVVFETAWRRQPGAYWVRLHRFERPFAFARIEAEVAGPNEIRVKADNVEEFSLNLAPPLINPAKEVRIQVVSSASPAAQPSIHPFIQPSNSATGWLRLRRQGDAWRPSGEPAGLHKTPSLEGPISHALMSSFVIVYGTQGKDELAKRVSREEAQITADRWNRWARGRARFKADTEVKAEDIRDCSLILVGDPATNSLVSRFSAKLPIRVEGNAILFGEKRFEGGDLGLQIVYPNPENPQRYVVLFTGTTWRGVYQISGRFNNWFDWGILDGWNWYDFAVYDDRTYSPETFLAIGYFDNDWQLNPAWTIVGDEPLRVAMPPRRTPILERVPESASELYLSELQPAHSRIEKGAVGRDRSFNAFPLTLGGRVFERGLGVHPDCELGFDLGGQFSTFEAVVGSDMEDEGKASEARDKVETIEYTVVGDGQTLYATGRMKWNSEPRHIFIPIPGVRRLDLRCQRRSGFRWLSGPCDWAIARVGEPLLNRTPVLARPPKAERLGQVLPLDGAWRLASFAVGEGVALQAHRCAPEAQKGALSAPVPGSVYAALAASPRTKDREGEASAEPRRMGGDGSAGASPSHAEGAAGREWWYWRSFDAPKDWEGRSVWLELDGAAYQADCWLNGRWVGGVTGPFALGRFDATKGVRLGGKNELAIRVVASPAPWAKEGKPFEPTPASGLVTSQELARLGCPPLGLWRPVRLRAAGPCLVRNLTVETVELSDEAARLRVRADVASVVKGKLAVSLAGTVAGEGFETEPVAFEQKLEVEGERTAPLEVEVRIPRPRLWWPWELGEQPLYRLSASAKLDGGAVSDEAAVRFGIRTIELDASSPTARLRVNAQKSLLLRGAVWMPADAFLRGDEGQGTRGGKEPLDTGGSSRASRVPRPPSLSCLLRQARECRFNVLHVWGGGLAETDPFYDLCDRMGLLVLQELPLTCEAQNAAASDVLRNCVDTIARLRWRPSLLAWCVGGAAKAGEPPSARLTAATAGLVERLDPQRRLVGDGARTGLSSLWTTRTDAAKGRTYWQGGSLLYAPGVPCPPTYATIQSWLGEDPVWPLTEPGMTAGTSSGGPWHSVFVRHSSFVIRHSSFPGASPAVEAYGPSRSAREHVLKAQTAHAAGVQRLIEHLRAAPASAVLWQLNEPAPACSPALFDAAGAPRPAYYFLQRALAPVAIFADLGADGPTTLVAGEELRTEICVASAQEPLKGAKAKASVLDRSLRPLKAWENGIDVEPGAIARPFPVAWTPEASLAGDVCFLHLRLDDAAGRMLASNLYWFGVVGRRAGGPRLRVAWLTGAPRGPLADPAFLGNAGIEVRRPKASGASSPKEKPPISLDGCEVVVVDAASVLTDYRDEDLRAVAEAVAKGTSLLMEGIESALADSGLGPLISVGLPAEKPEGVGGRPAATDPNHPALRRVAFESCPFLAPRGASDIKGSASVLVQLDAKHPLLVEGRHGRGRVLVLATRGGELAGWDELRRLYAGMLGYLAGLPHREQDELLDGAIPAPLQALGRLAPATVEATLKQEGEAVVVQLANPSGSLAFLLHLEAVPAEGNGPAPVPSPLAFSDNRLCLMPGESWVVRVDPAADGAPRGETGRAASYQLLLRGWNVVSRRLEGRLQMEGGRLRLRGR